MSNYGCCKHYGARNRFFVLVQDAITRRQYWDCIGMSYGLEKDLQTRGMLN